MRVESARGCRQKDGTRDEIYCTVRTRLTAWKQDLEDKNRGKNLTKSKRSGSVWKNDLGVVEEKNVGI